MCERVVLVNGLPGSGKSTLARALGRELGWPVLSKDAIKETLADTLDRPDGVGEAEWSQYERRVRHPVHRDPFVGDERWREWAAGARPLALGPVYWLDTAKEVEISGLAELCRAPQ
ncbi:AAA family ATPase [Nonomuraea sp. NPDC048882]|uniref:AAA family ATPase n=1 Tax=Nonomuraea sp. NPDC048882 TaxID=3154347 RepID=UPI0033EBC337